MRAWEENLKRTKKYDGHTVTRRGNLMVVEGEGYVKHLLINNGATVPFVGFPHPADHETVKRHIFGYNKPQLCHLNPGSVISGTYTMQLLDGSALLDYVQYHYHTKRDPQGREPCQK
ncbi:MAG: hypothetical protein V1708_05470 [Candidatus Micrarchaeota archaeon]